jgi:UV DNA damage endonuclease
MRIRLGYACVSETINITSSSNYTYTNYLKEKDDKKLDQIIVSNFLALQEILIYNIRNNIHFYRLSSGIIPLATKSDVEFDYTYKYKQYYDLIACLVKENNMRIDFHPNEYCVLNSVKKEVVQNSIEILKYHYQLLENFKIDNKTLILHIGSCTFGKKNSLTRFINNFKMLPKKIQECIVIENDDKIFTVEDCLYISDILKIPVCLDYHHYMCNRSDIDYEKIIKSFNTTPKMHFSSPKNKTKKDFRSHNDYIDCDEFIKFLEDIKYLDCDIDIMIEAKKKDEALFRLVRQLKYKTDYKFIDETTFII